MRRYLAICIITGLGSLAGFGQTFSETEVCPKAKTQTELNQCASDVAKSADAELSAEYAKLLSKVFGNQTATSKIKVAERAWIAYRDAYIDAMYPAANKQANYGSMFPMEVDLLRAKLTHEQVNALGNMLDHYNEPN